MEINEEQLQQLERIGNDLLKFVAILRRSSREVRCAAKTELCAVENRFGSNARKVIELLGMFGVDATMVRVDRGPVTSRFVLTIPAGVRFSAVTTLKNNLMAAFRTTGIRIEAPLFDEDAIGIEIPNAPRCRKDVLLKSLLKARIPQGCDLPLFIGKASSGGVLIEDLVSLPHLIVAGAPGQGKTTLLNTIVCGLVATRSPADVRLILYDDKNVEFTRYSDLPHLLMPVISDCRRFVFAMHWAVAEMEKRLKLFARARCRNISEYNRGREKMPYVVIIADEIAEMMAGASKELVPNIERLTAKARAAGIHLILSTQRADAKTLCVALKANVPGRISFKTISSVDSRSVLDEKGAEDLIGRGDMFLRRRDGQLVRVQGAIALDKDIAMLVNRANRKYRKQEPKVMLPLRLISAPVPSEPPSDDRDCEKAIDVIRTTQRASTSHFQRQLGWGYNHAAKILDMLEARGIVGPQVGAGPREILQLPKVLKKKRRR